MEVKKISRNLHAITLKREENRLALLSDIHWDNPKCDRVKLKRHLEYFKEHQIPIFINGDFFCLMQGRGDRRGNKSDILPEHNNAKYLDSVIETAVEWWSPYAHLLTVIGYGNHETSIIKYQETDVLQRFVDLLNYKNKTSVYTGGYGGWIAFKYKPYESTTLTKTMKYFHGSGGGGIVTKGAINLTRALEMYENMDIFVMGHIHENSSRNDVRDSIHYNQGKRVYELEQRQIHLAITGSYKEEYGDGFGGWHIERGAPVKPTGGRILTFDSFTINDKDGGKSYELLIDSIKIPL
jgi:UDP-2,3-diacylglucosamine pyrophosphatase LpxH